jgi:hypothetical protein
MLLNEVDHRKKIDDEDEDEVVEMKIINNDGEE